MNSIRKVQIETVRGCNARCRICTYKDQNSSSVVFMKEGVFRSIVNQLAGLGDIQVVCPYNHNEPLLDPQLFARIRTIKEHLPRVRIEVSTNGLLLGEENMDEFCRWVDDRWISFHGVNRQTYERNMGNLPWKNALKIRRLIRERPSEFFVLSIGMTPEYTEEEVRRFWRGFDNVKLMTFTPRSRAGNIRSDAVRYFFNPPESDYDCWRFSLFLMYSVRGDIIPCSNDILEKHVLSDYRQSLDAIEAGREAFRAINRSGSRTICWECEDADIRKEIDGRMAIQR